MTITQKARDESSKFIAQATLMDGSREFKYGNRAPWDSPMVWQVVAVNRKAGFGTAEECWRKAGRKDAARVIQAIGDVT